MLLWGWLRGGGVSGPCVGGPGTRCRLGLGLRPSRLVLMVLGRVEAVVKTHLCIDVQEHVVLINADQGGDNLAVSDRYRALHPQRSLEGVEDRY